MVGCCTSSGPMSTESHIKAGERIFECDESEAKHAIEVIEENRMYRDDPDEWRKKYRSDKR